MTEFVQIQTTTGDRAVAERIAAELVDRRLAACVQIAGPMTSTYRWQGEVESTEEYVCTLKCRAAAFDEVAELIGSLHPYDVPDVIATPISHASHAYGKWLNESLSP
ncbi:Divalent-cation tolerance protein CutA [Posidoniimonas polymericola]|uniref:Divalent-cation tolerance protein CutA n=1 Tax=Posidoniimonas polymericola TaxID=2528002 RepID=A0A5C5ZDX0_9BACT|nr:divalent-cation tolerance protein CutA [Posidoniimonas polymericola]TWT85522.1 Divalent-cation tolerance protein CutA [Posidoniimonas polymericola]